MKGIGRSSNTTTMPYWSSISGLRNSYAKVLRHTEVPTVEFGFGTQTATGTDRYTTTAAVARNAISNGTLPILYDRFTNSERRCYV